MDTLYVCRANIARSQMAAALHHHFYPRDLVGSAGTHVQGNHGYDGQLLTEFARSNGVTTLHVLTVLQEMGIDTTGLQRRQLTEKMVHQYSDTGRIVVMAEIDDWPDYLLRSPKVLKWKVEDPKNQSLEFYRDCRNHIQQLVHDSQPRWTLQ